MMCIKIFLSLVFFFTLIACRMPFQPPPYAFQEWKRPKTTEIVTKKIMMECGYPNPAGEGWGTEQNKIALMHLCMEKNGFRYTNEFGTYCFQHPNLPACVAAAEKKR